MHTFTGRFGATFQYNPDLSGVVAITVGGLALEVSGLEVLDFVAQWIRDMRVAALETAESATLLGVRKQDMPLWSAPAKTAQRATEKAAVAPPSAPAPTPAPPPVEAKAIVNPNAGANAPTEKQVAFFCRLLESHVFTEEERKRAYEWLATRATRQLIKDQIDWAKRTVELRHAEEKKA